MPDASFLSVVGYVFFCFGIQCFGTASSIPRLLSLSNAPSPTWPNFDGVSSEPDDPGRWRLALNIDTGDGNVVDYSNSDFWQDALALGGATNDTAVALVQDYKNPDIFAGPNATDILVVVHEEGVVRGWRSWALVADDKPLLDYFDPSSGRSGGCNPDDMAEATLVSSQCNTLATTTTGGDIGSLVYQEPMVYNDNDNAALYTNGCGANDCNRLSTVCQGPGNLGYGLGTLYDSDYDSNGKSCLGITTRPMCDAQMHSDQGHWGSTGGIGGLIG